MMFAQANSEHCRHKIFNADWIVDGERAAFALRHDPRTRTRSVPAARCCGLPTTPPCIEGATARASIPAPAAPTAIRDEPDAHYLAKVETHNHPTAISPFPGAATGSGGEIRDEGATGRGSKPKAGLCGFSVSNLRIPGYAQPWEQPYGKPERIASALDIMIEGPIGAAAFNNEFGRPNLAGYFRTFEQARARWRARCAATTSRS
jgi:phosphoribosylformylglycinamidine synthase